MPQKSREVLDRLRDLPEALCAACGAPVGAGDGITAPEGAPGRGDAWSNSAHVDHDRADVDRKARGLTPVLRWQRRHDACPTTGTTAVKVLLDRDDLTDGEAEAIAARYVGTVRRALLASRQFFGPDARDAPGRAWQHVDRAALADAAKKVLARSRGARCSTGPCAACGASHSTRWSTSPLRWSSGGPASFCGSCATHWEQAGKPFDIDEIRFRVGLRSLAGFNGSARPYGAFGIRLAVEVLGDDERDAKRDAWSFRPEQLAAVRERVWAEFPKYAPLDEQAERLAAKAERERDELRAARAEQVAEEVARNPFVSESWAS
ncbi:hypothetical protein [Agromyces italicus]|uniref:hypothetical protein n=1 Tax=Agromyces italicus TaxID=279572 RepID=UPI0003B30816|nr:hypothetical protein [Agromyces italicus]